MQAGIRSNLKDVQERINAACRRAGRRPEEITLIAVTKTVDAASIEAAYREGVRHFGENRVQEAAVKIRQLSCLNPAPVWHMIGHLQSNKVKPALEHFDLVHSIDTLELAENLNRRAERRTGVLLQVNVAAETTKSGFGEQDICPAFEAVSRLTNLEVRGLMTVAPLVKNPEEVRPVFRRLRTLRDSLGLEHLSMGMTDDFEVAIEEGATMVRIGRAIFGERIINTTNTTNTTNSSIIQ